MFVSNSTPFEFVAMPNYDREAREVFTNIVKATYSLTTNNSLEIADKQVPITEADEYWGEPGASPLKYESDFAVFKPSTDLILLGTVHNYKKIKSIEVAFGVASKKKRAVVRSADARTSIPLVSLEFLDGSKDGRGAGWSQVGFGFYPKQYEPRVRYAGTYDEQWRKDRFPFLPVDFDYRFFQAAYPDLITGAYLRGNERLFAENVSPQGQILLDLPGIGISIETRFEKKTISANAMLDTVILEPDKRSLTLIWRQMIPSQGLIPAVQGFKINMSKP